MRYKPGCRKASYTGEECWEWPNACIFLTPSLVASCRLSRGEVAGEPCRWCSAPWEKDVLGSRSGGDWGSRQKKVRSVRPTELLEGLTSQSRCSCVICRNQHLTRIFRTALKLASGKPPDLLCEFGIRCRCGMAV